MSNEDLRRLLDDVEANPTKRSAWRSLERALLRMGYTHAAQPVKKWKECCKPEPEMSPWAIYALPLQLTVCGECDSGIIHPQSAGDFARDCVQCSGTGFICGWCEKPRDASQDKYCPNCGK